MVLNLLWVTVLHTVCKSQRCSEVLNICTWLVARRLIVPRLTTVW